MTGTCCVERQSVAERAQVLPLGADLRASGVELVRRKAEEEPRAPAFGEERRGVVLPPYPGT